MFGAEALYAVDHATVIDLWRYGTFVGKEHMELKGSRLKGVLEANKRAALRNVTLKHMWRKLTRSMAGRFSIEASWMGSGLVGRIHDMSSGHGSVCMAEFLDEVLPPQIVGVICT